MLVFCWALAIGELIFDGLVDACLALHLTQRRATDSVQVSPVDIFLHRDGNLVTSHQLDSSDMVSSSRDRIQLKE